MALKNTLKSPRFLIFTVFCKHEMRSSRIPHPNLDCILLHEAPKTTSRNIMRGVHVHGTDMIPCTGSAVHSGSAVHYRSFAMGANRFIRLSIRFTTQEFEILNWRPRCCLRGQWWLSVSSPHSPQAFQHPTQNESKPSRLMAVTAMGPTSVCQ